MRSMRTFLLTAATVAGLLLPGFVAASFPDVPAEHPSFTAISDVQGRGIVSGYPDGTYRPDALINRAEFTKIIIAAFDAEEVRLCHLKRDLDGMFPDMRATDWYAPYVCAANQRNWVHGYPDGFFRGNAVINFAEASKILTFRYALQEDVTDVWYERSVRALAGRQAIPLTITSFNQPITRGEMAEMIYRLDYNLRLPSQTYESLSGSPRTQKTRVYTDSERIFSLTYPVSWTVSEQGDGTAQIIVQGGQTFPGKNFVHNAFIRAGVHESCPATQPSPGTVVQTITLGGHPFTAVETNDGAAGTSYNQITFTSPLSPSRCLVLEKVIGISNVLQETPEDAREAARQLGMTQDVLKDVLKTLVVYGG